jgi:hypothetical protein
MGFHLTYLPLSIYVENPARGGGEGDKRGRGFLRFVVGYQLLNVSSRLRHA